MPPWAVHFRLECISFTLDSRAAAGSDSCLTQWAATGLSYGGTGARLRSAQESKLGTNEPGSREGFRRQEESEGGRLSRPQAAEDDGCRLEEHSAVQ
jgi:hypothetical protein